jgi:hypothetical protein
VEIYFQYLQGKPPFDSEQKRSELMRRLNEVEGFNLTDDQLTRRPTRPLTLLKDPRALEKFKEAIEWGLSVIRQVG